MAKLTLHVPEDLVATAKSEAAARQVSVSKLVSDYFRNLSSASELPTRSKPDLGPRTQRLVGCIPDADIENYIDYLEAKHS